MSGLDYALGGVVLVLIGAMALIALAETSLTRMNVVKALTLEEQGRRGAGRLARMMDHPERWLNPLLFVNLVCSSVAAGLITLIADRAFGAWGVVASLAFEVLFVFVVAEAIPKTWAIQHPSRSALVSAPLVSGLAAFPPVRLLARGLIAVANFVIPGTGLERGPFVSEEELLVMADVAEVEEVIEREERALIHSIIEFGDTVVREVRVPRPDMIAVQATSPVGEVLDQAIEAGYSRIPVFDDGVDDVVGIVFTKDLMRAMGDGLGSSPVRSLARPAHFVPETKRVSELMREMQAEKFHIAIVVDEYGGTAGLVTLEDLIEELVGEIVDEFDVEEPLIEGLPTGESRVNARMPVDEVNDLLHAHLPQSDDWDTVGGLLLHELGHVPDNGESVEIGGWQLTAERVQGRRIGRVRLTPPLSAASGPAPADRAADSFRRARSSSSE